MVPPAMHTGRSARAAARRSDAISKRLPQPPRMCCARCCMQPPAVLCGLTAFYADPTSRPPGRPHPADAAHGPLPKRSARARMLTFAAPQAKESSSARRSWPPCPRGDTAEPRPPSRPPAPAPAPRSPLTAASSPMMPPRSTSVASCGLSRAPHSQRLPCPATAEHVCTRSAVRVAPHTHARSAAHGSSSLLQAVSQWSPTLLQTCCPCAKKSNDSAQAAPEGASAGVLNATRRKGALGRGLWQRGRARGRPRRVAREARQLQRARLARRHDRRMEQRRPGHQVEQDHGHLRAPRRPRSGAPRARACPRSAPDPSHSDEPLRSRFEHAVSVLGAPMQGCGAAWATGALPRVSGMAARGRGRGAGRRGGACHERDKLRAPVREARGDRLGQAHGHARLRSTFLLVSAIAGSLFTIQIYNRFET